MSAKDIFDYWQLPRDGRAMFLHDTPESCAQFIHEASDAAYVLIPAPYADLIAKWIVDCPENFRSAPMTQENMRGGFIGTCNSVEMFTDAFAGRDRKYPAGAPALFGQWGGAFTRALEMERCPYYNLRHTLNPRETVNFSVWSQKAISNAGQSHRNGIGFDRQIACILLPCRFLQDFFNDAELMADYKRRPSTGDVEQSFNGLLGFWRNIPIHSDAHLHPKMVNKDDPITWSIEKLYP
jgi:hypothetical protein|uniref:Uncharacterized protein n=1 Tax=Myoviridae sp. ctshb19 TaxID=2825194 RepID=A0A8S5UH33_9CAUD|nr:MAG TPA: hypothetical protein [Myoviridae sp. ctshb19]